MLRASRVRASGLWGAHVGRRWVTVLGTGKRNWSAEDASTLLTYEVLTLICRTFSTLPTGFCNKVHTLGGLNHRHLFLTVLVAGKCPLRVPTDSGVGEALSPSCSGSLLEESLLSPETGSSGLFHPLGR